ncbi:MAG: MATE family efflux transporter [Spirochaetales bacterium]|nr:MATE family efflux transporter [Spirochaetales bacterium]
MIAIAFPILVQSLLNNALSFVDTLMIGQLGEAAIAAVSLANQMFFLIALLFFGVASGTSIFLSQYWGAKDDRYIRKIMALSLVFVTFSASVFALVSLLVPEAVMHIFTREAQVVSGGVSYLKIVAISYIFSAITQIFSTALRVTGHAKTPLKIALLALSLNAVGNYLLIFGIGPFPVLGIAGAALATTLSRLVEVVLLLIVVYRKHPHLAIRDREAFRWPRPFIRHVVPTSLPVLFNEVAWALGIITYEIAYSRIGIDAIAAVNITENIGNLFFVALQGLSNATLIMIGIKIGEHDYPLARRWSWRFVLVAVTVGAVMGGFELFFAPFFAGMFKIGAELRATVGRLLTVNAMILPFRAFNLIVIVGILRAGGDTRFSMFAEMFGVWGIGVPLAFIGVLFLNLPIVPLYILVAMEEVFKLLIGLGRLKSGKWLNDLTVHAHEV